MTAKGKAENRKKWRRQCRLPTLDPDGLYSKESRYVYGTFWNERKPGTAANHSIWGERHKHYRESAEESFVVWNCGRTRSGSGALDCGTKFQRLKPNADIGKLCRSYRANNP